MYLLSTMRFVFKARYRRYIIATAFFSIVVFVTSSFVSMPVTPSPAAASDTASRWVKVNTPASGESGGWVLAPGSDIRCLTMAPDGTLYAYGAGLTYSLLKSNNGGIKWSCVGQVQNVITAIAVSPQNPDILYYATNTSVYRSADGGNSFIQLPVPGGAGTGHKEITSLAAGWLTGSIIAASTRDADSGEWGGVYLFDESAMVPAWTDAGIGNYDVYRVAFSPAYANDQQIIAVATDETNSYVFNRTGISGWNALISPAQLYLDNAGNPAALAIGHSASIAFPDDYSAASESRSLYVGIDAGTGLGDVFKITCSDAPAPSTAQDLNISGPHGAIDVCSLAARGENGAVVLAAGASGDNRIFTSTDGGNTWKKSLKAPAGSGNTSVLFSPDFNATGEIYAATSGAGSGFSISRDTGNTWNQASLIDSSIDNILEITCSPEYSLDNTLFMVTTGSGPGTGSLWRTVNGGVSWERVFSGPGPSVETIEHVGLPPAYGPGCHTIFVSGESNGNPAIWSSEDNGQSFRPRFTYDHATGAPFPVDAMAIIDDNTLFVSSYNGAQSMVYRAGNRGFTFTPGVPAGNQPIHSIVLSPDFPDDKTIIAGNSAGGVYRSVDGGASFSPLPSDGSTPPNPGMAHIAFDPAYKENRIIYFAGDNSGAGFYRLNTADDDGWVSLNATLPAGAVIDSISVSGNGILYGVNSNSGGLERCIDPRARTPVFETVTSGLSAGATLVGIRQSGNRIWAVDSTNCKLMTYNDTLTEPVVQDRPADTASGTGSLANHAVKDVTITWETMTGATDYEWQCTDSKDFFPFPPACKVRPPAVPYACRRLIRPPLITGASGPVPRL